MEETLTVTRLGLTGPLLNSLASSNLIESVLSVIRTVTSWVKTWQDAGMLRNKMDAAEYKHVVLGLIFLKYL